MRTAVEETRSRQGDDLIAWVKQMLITENPWEVLERHFAKLTHGDLCDEALLILLEDAAKVVIKDKIYRPVLVKMADSIITAAKAAISSYRELARHNQHNNQKKPIPPELRPADIYRRFAKPLRWLRDQGSVNAALILKEIMLEQTLPFEELDNPHWIDPYTKSVDPEADRPGDIRVRFTEPVIDTELAKQMKEDLGWDEETFRVFLSAQEGFNSEDGLEQLFQSVSEEDGREDRVPHWMEIQNDCHPTDEIHLIRSEAKQFISACRKLIDQLVKEENELADLSDKFWRVKAVNRVKSRFRASQEAADLISFLQDKADEGAAPADIAAIFLSMQHGYGFDEEDANMILLRGVPNFRTLGEWIDFWGDELLEALHDAPWRWREISTKEIDELAEQTVAEILHDHQTNNIFRSRAFMEGYLRCMLNANRIIVIKDGKRHNLAIEAGWEAWRQWKNPEANRAFHAARAEGKDFKTAMAAFWKIVRDQEKRISNGTVVSAKPTGLILSSGRFINWKIALIKLMNNELYFPEGKRESLKKALIERGIGLEFAKSL